MSLAPCSWPRVLPASVLALLAIVAGGRALAQDAVTPTPVSDKTMKVAVLPRPPKVKTNGRHNCPDKQKDLTRWDPAWIDAEGVVTLPAASKILVRGNKDIPADLLIRDLQVPASSELIFANRDATFRVRDMHVFGALRLGSAECRTRKHIEFVFDTDEDVADPTVRDAIHARAGLGLVIEPGGVFEAFGHLRQPTWTRLAATAVAGSAEIRLAESVNWKVGSEIVVVTSVRRDYPFTDQNELRSIVGKKPGKTLVLDHPLDYLHYGGPEYQVEVALLSHNIVFRTAPSVLAAAPAFGGHIMMHAAEARVSGIEARGLGQQNFLGRYPLHFHHMGDVGHNSYLTDNSIRDSNWRCAVIHRTDNAIVSRNVAFNAYGHCYYVEDGVEQGNEISYNLAAGIKIMGPVDETALEELAFPSQDGFTLNASADFVNPADRAAAGFYISNANNQIFGNAASGGFAGYSFPGLPEPIGGGPAGLVPFEVPIRNFDGNSAHSSAYFWGDAGCVYVGGVLRFVNEGYGPTLQYTSGRAMSVIPRRLTEDLFTNTKTFLCEVGIVHWGDQPRVVNLEAWDVGLMAQLFGTASIQSAIAAGTTGNTANQFYRPRTGFQRGFRFYDTGTLTILRGIVFRGFHRDPFAIMPKTQDSCALISLNHSNQYTPQRMNTTAEFFFPDTDDAQRICHDDVETLASRNFNLNDTDGSLSHTASDPLPPGPRILGSGYIDAWHMNENCVLNDDWGLWVCPQQGTRNVASIATLPNDGVHVAITELDGQPLGENWYSDTHFDEAQISGPSGTRWHHSFPSGTPSSFVVHAIQVPENSFVLYSFDLPGAAPCHIQNGDWGEVADIATLLTTSEPAYTTELGTCYIRIPPASRGDFVAAGLSLPLQTWPYWPPTWTFTVDTE
jgi:G8 domain